MKKLSHQVWNVLTGSALFLLLILFIAPAIRPLQAQVNRALDHGVEQIDRALPSQFATPSPLPEDSSSGVFAPKIQKGDTVTQELLAQSSPLPPILAERFTSETGRCIFRVIDDEVITIHTKTLRILDLTEI